MNYFSTATVPVIRLRCNGPLLQAFTTGISHQSAHRDR